ncbi:MAG TPA: CHAT domain-containing protein, partial [Steroidobacteraceae bacterium]|nr:CHAT domain-containing protein [Steroidobacteraceae bacterium]
MTRATPGARSRAALTLALLGILSGSGCRPAPTPTEPLAAVPPLVLSGRGEVRFSLEIPADRHVALLVSGQAIDVQVALEDADGTTIERVDAPGRATGTEVLLLDPGPARSISMAVSGHDYATVEGEVRVEATVLPNERRADRERIAAYRKEMLAAAIERSAYPTPVEPDAEHLAAAADAYQRLGLTTAAARARIAEAWVQGWRDWDYAAAVTSATAALELTRDADDHEMQAHALLWLGAAQTSLAQGVTRTESERARRLFDASEQALTAAAEAYEQLALPRLAALALSYRGVAQHYAGDWAAAEASYNAASERWLAIGDTAQHTLALQSLALLWHERGEPRRAIESFDAALALRDSVPATDYAYMLYNSALPHYVLGLFDEAIERYYAAMEILEAAGDRPGEARALQGIGTVLQAAGERERAREVLERVVAMRPPGSDDRARAYALLLLGEIERDLGDVSRAIDLHEEALALTSTPNDEIRARVALAIGLAQSGQHESADAHLDAALALPLPEAHRVRARAWRERGVVKAALGRRAASGAAFDEALRLYDATGAELERAYVLEARARVAFDGGQLEQAIVDGAEARSILNRTSALGIHASQRAVFLASRRSTLGLEIEGRLVLAQAARTQGATDRADLLERQAFEASDRSRSVLLLDSIAADRRALPRDLLDRRRDLLEQLAGKRARQDALLERTEPDPITLEQIEADIVRVRSELDAIAARIGEFDRASDAAHMSTEAVELVPPADATVAEFFLGERRSWLFIVSGGDVAVHPLPARAQIDERARLLYDAWSSPSSDPADAAAAASDLRNWLIGPIEQSVTSHRLFIVADGSLHLLPLAALAKLTNSPLADRDFVTVPSLLATLVAPAERAAAPRALAMIADPVYAADDPRVSPNPQLAQVAVGASQRSTTLPDIAASPVGLERLPAAATEARDILALVPESERLALLGFEARRERITGSTLEDYRIVHFATHAWADSRDPGLATLALSAIDESGNPIDGVLRAADLA